MSSVRISGEEIAAWLDKHRPRRVLVQAPLGLKHLVPRVVDPIKRRGVEVIVSSGSCWGGCDVSLDEAIAMGAEGIIHIGHAPFMKIPSIPVLYVEARYTDPSPLIQLAGKAAEFLDGFNSVGLGATVQWLDHLDSAAEILARRGIRVEIGGPSGRLAHRGQVLGCDYSSLKMMEERVECFLVIGSVFHALGLGLISRKPVLAGDPHTQKLTWLSDMVRSIYAQRYANIMKLRDAKRIGVIVSTKPGQMLPGLARRIAALLESRGYEAEIIVTNEVSESIFTENVYDAYVNTACPRLSIEDQARLGKPLLLPSEVLVALGMLSWDKLVERGLLLGMSV